MRVEGVSMYRLGAKNREEKLRVAGLHFCDRTRRRGAKDGAPILVGHLKDAGPSTAVPPHRTGAPGAPGLRFGRDDKFMGAMQRVLAPGDLLRTY